MFPHREFDREKKTAYSFEVYATDGGLYGPRSDRVRIDVTILDVNDNSPIFEKIPYSVDIAQNHAVSQYVERVRAVDKDSGDNGKVLYAFKTPSRYFSIDADTGVIILKSLLDATAVMMHRLRIVARDHGDAPRSSTGEGRVFYLLFLTFLTFSDHLNIFVDQSSPSFYDIVSFPSC